MMRKRSNNPDETEVQSMIAGDADAPEATADQLAQAKPFTETFPALAEAMRRNVGRPPSDNAKVAVSLRLDQDVIEKFRATGPGWQSRVNRALREAAGLS